MKMPTAAITRRQATIWFIMHQLGSAILVLPSTLATVAKQDAWLSVLCAWLLQYLCIPLYVSLVRQMKERTLHEFFVYLFGRWIGKTCYLLYIVAFPYLIFALSLRNLGDYITTSIMGETPIQAVYVLMLIAVIYGVRQGCRVIGRAAEVFFPLILVLILVSMLSLLPEVEIRHLLPVYENGWKKILRASLLLYAFPYLETVLFLVFMPLVKDEARLKFAMRVSTAVSITIFFFVTLLALMALSAEVTENLTFPSYFVIRTISFGNFYERFEVLIAVIYFITIFFRLSLLMYVTSNGIAETFGLTEAAPLLIPLALIAYYLADIISPNMPYLLEFISIWPSYTMLFGIVLPLLWWIVARVRDASSVKE